ncbi:MAG: hypothetical protein WCP57_10395 [Bacteroidota bacterium]
MSDIPTSMTKEYSWIKLPTKLLRMNKKLLALLILGIIFNNTMGQKNITIDNGCSYLGELKSTNIYLKECTNPEILKIIDDILRVVSLQKNFEIYEADIENAMATKYGGSRLIILDPKFLDEVKVESKDKLSSYLIIAHEIGHHLNIHTERSNNASPWWDELEADHFAGAVIHKLGIEPVTMFNVLSVLAPKWSIEQSKSSHPDWTARVKAAINGYSQSVFSEVKISIKSNQEGKLDSLISSQKQLELLLNENIFNKDKDEKESRYRVTDKKIIRNYETLYYNGQKNSTYRYASDTIDLKKVYKIYARWHDLGEFNFVKYDESESFLYLLNPETRKQLPENWNFDDEYTLYNTFYITYSLNQLVAKIQRYSE